MNRNGLVAPTDRDRKSFTAVRVRLRCKFEVRCLLKDKVTWSRGRAARQSSAKASTAVRIRSRPHESLRSEKIEGFFLFIRTTLGQILSTGVKQNDKSCIDRQP